MMAQKILAKLYIHYCQREPCYYHNIGVFEVAYIDENGKLNLNEILAATNEYFVLYAESLTKEKYGYKAIVLDLAVHFCIYYVTFARTGSITYRRYDGEISFNSFPKYSLKLINGLMDNYEATHPKKVAQ